MLDVVGMVSGVPDLRLADLASLNPITLCSCSGHECLPFLVTEQQGLTDALTADQHFVQAGFRALMLEE